MKSAAHLIALFLQSEGLGTLGTDLHVGTEPATPNDCVTVYDTGALRPALIGGSENTGYRTARHAIQIRCRASSYTVAAARLQSIRVALHKMQKHSEAITGNADVTAQIIEGAWLQSFGLSLGLDENNRSRITDNWEVLVWFEAALLGCAITLTHEGLDAFGLQPMTVVGQTVSVTGDGVSDYGMSTGLAGVPVDWTGVCVVAKKIITDPASGFVILHLVKPDSSLSARIFWNQGSGEWEVETINLVTDTKSGFVNVGGAVTDRPALGVDGATGDVTAYLNGDVVADKNTQGTFGQDLTDLGGMFATDNVIVLDVATGLGNGDTYSAEIITQADKYTQSYPAGSLDWCGNPLS